jgi:hypothetical protein
MKAVRGLVSVIAALATTFALTAGASAAPPSSPVNQVQQAWTAFQQSSATPTQKVEETAEVYLELPLLTGQNRVLFSPAFLMEPHTTTSSYAIGVARAFYQSWKDWNGWILSYNYTPQVLSASVSGDTATVTILPSATETMISGPSTPVMYPATQHTLTLAYQGGVWLVAGDSYSNELTSVYGPSTNWDNVVSHTATTDNAEIQSLSASRPQSPTMAPLTNCGSQPCVVYYQPNRSVGVSYAEQYALTYNPLFKSYAPDDCADFVSQSIWAEFGGVNTATAINSHEYPMRDNVGGTNWWADAYGTDTDWDWTAVPNLKNLMEQNYANNGLGIQGTPEQIGAVLAGDWVWQSDLGHALFVTEVTSSPAQWSTIYISAHTNNHDNVPIDQVYASPSDVGFEAVVGYRAQ